MDIRTALDLAGIGRTDIEVLVAFVLQCDRAYILAHPEKLLTKEQQDQWEQFVKRRREGEPVAYIIGQREFYGRVFSVDRRVHIPRPSTENLVTMTLDFLQNPKDEVRELETGIIGVARVIHKSSIVKTVVDVGTGSGCIAITLALERPNLQIIAIDISPEALEVARNNAQKYGVESRIRFLCGNLLEPISLLAEPFVAVSNPPYLSKVMIAAYPDIHFEPRIALDGGKDGADVPIMLLQHAEKNPLCVGVIIECLTQQNVFSSIHRFNRTV